MHRVTRQAGDVQVRLKGLELAAEGVALSDHVENPEVVAVEHDQAGASAQDGPVESELPQRTGQTLPFHAQGHDRRLAARRDHRVESLQVGRPTHLGGVCAE